MATCIRNDRRILTGTRARRLRAALLRTTLMVLGVVLAQMSHGVARGASDPVPSDPSAPPVLPYPAVDPIVASEAAGNLSGSSSVTPTGQFTYRLPIDVPPGRAGMQPSLALRYTSGSGNGLLGVGWSLDGLSEIRRCHKTWATERTADGVDFDDTDAFCLDGQKLRQINADVKANGHEGAEYRTERDSFSRIVAHGDSGAGPTRFTVEAKSGLVMDYSQLVEAPRLQGGFPDEEPTVLGTVRAVWLLREVHDRSGNAMVYQWDVLPNPDTLGIEYRIKEIRFTGKHVEGGEPTGDKRRVEFHYDKRAAGDETFRYESGIRWETNHVLDKITLFAPNPTAPAEIGEYRLHYSASADTGRTLLESVERCDAEDVCLRSKKFSWWQRSSAGEPPVQFDDIGVTLSSAAVGDFPELVLVADVNGDGLDDVLYRTYDITHAHKPIFLAFAQKDASGAVSFAPSVEVNAQGMEFSDADLGKSRAADIDGDGKVEIFAAIEPADHNDPSGFQIFRWNDGQTRFLPVGDFLYQDPATDVVQLTDADGDGRIDMFRETPDPNPANGGADWGKWLLAKNGWTDQEHFKFQTAQPTTLLSIQGQFARAMDIDGDGRGDLLPIEAETTLDGSDDVGLIPGATIELGLGDDGQPETQGQWRLRSFARMVLADLNGDGLRDAFYPAGPGSKVRWNLGNGFAPLTHLSSPIVTIADASQAADLGLRPVDMDGDGIEDLVSFMNEGDLPGAPQMRLFRRRGGQIIESHLEPPGTIPYTEGGGAIQHGWPYCTLGDFNGDGLTDIVHLDLSASPQFQLRAALQRQAPSDVLFEVSDEDSPTAQQGVFYGRTTPDASASCTWPQLCVRRGLPVVTMTASSAGGELAAVRYKHYSYEDGRVDLQGRGFLGFGRVSVFDPQLRTQTTTTFDNVTRLELPTGGSFYPYAGLPSVRRHVAAIFDTPTDGTEWPPLPAGPLTGRITTTTYHYNESTPNDPDALWSIAGAGTYVVHGVGSTTIETEGPVSVDSTAGTVDLAGPAGADFRQVDTATAYDAYENPTVVSTTTDGGTFRWTATTYDNRVPDWLLGLPVHSETGGWDAGTPAVIREADAQFDSLGRLQSTNLEPNGGAALRRATVFLRDENGLPTEIDVQTDPGTRKAFIAYDDQEGMFPRASWNQLGHASRAVFHPGYGVPVVTEDPNGVQVKSTYDRFGRVRGVTPDGGTAASLSYASNDCKTSAAQKGMCTSVAFVGGGEQVAYSDEYGRTWETGNLGFDGTMVFRRQQYNLFGQAVRATRPFTDFEQGVTIATFDSLGRPLEIKAPDTTATTFAYLGMFDATSTDPNQRSVTVHHDKDGRIVELYDVAAAPTRYGYGPFDQITSIEDPQGNVTRLGHDDLGRRTLLVDPDQGTTTFEHDAFGAVRFVHHHTGDEASATDLDTEYRHDILGRVVRRLDTVDGDTSAIEITDYEYDAGPHALGKLSHTRSPDGIETAHAYDDFGRPWVDQWGVDGAWYGFKRDYEESTGRPSALRYPDNGESFTVGFHYNPAGWLDEVNRPAWPVPKKVWQVGSRNLDGMLTGASWNESEVAESRSYSPLTGRLHQITVKGDNSLVDLTYGYDLGGNVTSRVDGVADRIEGFHYDDADRLAQWDLKYPVAGGGHVDRTVGYAYDDLGNLTGLFKDGILDEVHEMDPVRPHRLASVQLLAKSVVRSHLGDPRGRDQQDEDQDVTPPSPPGQPPPSVGVRTVQYTPFDLPRRVSRSDGQPLEVDFAYDAFGTRVKKTTSAAGVLTTTISLGGLYERREQASAGGATVQHLFYVHGDDGPVAQIAYDEATQEETPTYLAKDGLGSVSVAFGEKGTEVGRFFHEPFGRRVDVDGEPLKGPPSNGLVSIGFTGQTQDDDLDLIDMRGRVYDPVQKRFLTPDPLVADPLHSQAYNRYAYVLNNPLGYIDPSGFGPIPGSNTGPAGGADKPVPEYPVVIIVQKDGPPQDQAPVHPVPSSDATGHTPPQGPTAAPAPEPYGPPLPPPPTPATPEETPDPLSAMVGPAGTAFFQGMQDQALDMAIGALAAAARIAAPTSAPLVGLGSNFDPQPIPEVTGNAWADLALNTVPITRIGLGIHRAGSALGAGDPYAAGRAIVAPAVEIATIAVGAALGAGAAADQAVPNTLFHYTDELGHTGILESRALNPSLKSLNPADVRYGNGQYLSDIAPGTRTPAQLSRHFLGQPFQGARFTHFIEIDVTGLDVVLGRPGVFVIPNEGPLSLLGRIVSSGAVP